MPTVIKDYKEKCKNRQFVAFSILFLLSCLR